MAGFTSASGFQGLENSPLARIGYHNKIIGLGWEKDFLPEITNTEIDGRIHKCNQIVQFMRQPTVGPWRSYEKNQELVPDLVSPEGFCMTLDNAKYKALKFDDLDIKRICNRWESFEDSFLDSMYETLAAEWRSHVLCGMALEALPQNKGANAGRLRNVNLGAPGAPKAITGASFGRELARMKTVLVQRNRWVDGEMIIVLPSGIGEILVDSPYANAFDMGRCMDCSLLLTGEIPGKLMGARTFVTNSLCSSIEDTMDGAEAFHVIMAHRDAYAFAGDIIEGRIVKPAKYFGTEYQTLAVWGGEAILPDAIAVGYWTLDVPQ